MRELAAAALPLLGLVVAGLAGIGVTAALAPALAGDAQAALAPLAARVFDEPRLDDIVLALSVMVFFSGGLNWFYEALMQRELEFRNRFLAQMVQAFAYTGIGVLLAALGGQGLADALDDLLGRSWDDELEPFRYAGDGAQVRWLHEVV